MAKGLVFAFIAALAVAMSGAARAETTDQLYQKAKGEGALLFYSGGPVEPYERWAKEFMQKFPGVDVKVEGGFSNVLDSKINQQIAARKMDVDMALLQTVQDFVGWKKKGAADPLSSRGRGQDRSALPRQGRDVLGDQRRAALLCVQHQGFEAE